MGKEKKTDMNVTRFECISQRFFFVSVTFLEYFYMFNILKTYYLRSIFIQQCSPLKISPRTIAPWPFEPSSKYMASLGANLGQTMIIIIQTIITVYSIRSNYEMFFT